MFDTAALNLYLQKDGGWSNGTIQLTGPHSLIATAAATGNPASSTSHTMTVVDEQSISNLGTTDALAIPVLMDSHADSCAAVLLVGLTKSRLMEIAGSSDLIDRYQSIARSIFTVQKEPSISIERLDSFAREIIHEANNPISTVQNYLKVLSLKLDPEHEAQETLEIISEELFRAADIIRSFREIQPDESDTQNSCQVNKVVRDITSLFEKANERLEFSCALDSENPVGAVSTESLKQCITNLIKNATEALQPGGTITVTTTAGFRQAGQTYLEITVADNGPGIDTTLEDIFARGATTKAGEHAGQGLAVVQNLCTQANGFISYRTGDNGTEFRMTIPQINTSTQS
jgi:signal transduction histidine kinase